MKELSIDPSSKKAKGSWSKRIEKGEDSEEIRVKEIMNGFLITKNKNWRDEKGEYHYDTEEMFSETNPLEEKEEVANDKKVETMYKKMFGGLFGED